MTTPTRLLLFLGLVVCASGLAACGGGGGGGGGDNGPILLREQLMGRSGSGTTGPDTEFIVFVRFGPADMELPLGVVATDDDGLVLDADPLHPAFAALIDILTNGQDDTLKVVATINGNESWSFASDTSNHQTDQLAGPDLIGAGITQIAFRVDTVDIVPGTSYEILGYMMVVGFPN